MPDNKDDKPKIIVDDDWKQQAQAEKERLAAEAETPAAGQELPEPSFASLLNMLVTNIFMALGGVEDPQTKKRYVDLTLAKHYIDLLAMLETKTKGNLTDEEKKMLDGAIYEMRMQYVQIAQHVAGMTGQK